MAQSEMHYFSRLFPASENGHRDRMPGMPAERMSSAIACGKSKVLACHEPQRHRTGSQSRRRHAEADAIARNSQKSRCAAAFTPTSATRIRHSSKAHAGKAVSSIAADVTSPHSSSFHQTSPFWSRRAYHAEDIERPWYVAAASQQSLINTLMVMSGVGRMMGYFKLLRAAS